MGYEKIIVVDSLSESYVKLLDEQKIELTTDVYRAEIFETKESADKAIQDFKTASDSDAYELVSRSITFKL